MNRKVAYSGKKKREQLRAKKQRKAEEAKNFDPRQFELKGRRGADKPISFVPAENDNMETSDFSNTQNERTKLVSVFEKLTPQQIEKGKLDSMKPLQRLPQTCLEVDPDTFKNEIDFPKRPTWDYSMTKEQLDQRESEYFKNWLKETMEKYPTSELSWFEKNLEVWRQLWRVLEISDVIIVVMDIRHPLLHFPTSLYHYVTNVLKRKMIGVFNKVDLVSEFTVFAWRKYFEQEFPNLRTATFSCYPRDKKLIGDTKTYALKNQVKRPRNRVYSAQGVKDIMKLCRDMVDKPDVHVNWKRLISKYNEDHELVDSDSEDDDDSDTGSMDGLDEEFSRIFEITAQEIKPHKDYITLGIVGHPNVGKSSLINSIMRKTVVSASKTPGHTKHFQTIHISDNVRLCDSPGLVFPALIPRALQIISGMYAIAQVQEPYSTVQYIAERTPLEKILALTPPVPQDEDFEYTGKTWDWSAWEILEVFAEQRGFHIAKTSSPDEYRAANVILRLTAEGRILVSFKPPGFFTSTKYEKLKIIEADAQKTDESSSSFDEATSEEEEDFEEEIVDIKTGGSFAALMSDADA